MKGLVGLCISVWYPAEYLLITEILEYEMEFIYSVTWVGVVLDPAVNGALLSIWKEQSIVLATPWDIWGCLWDSLG